MKKWLTNCFDDYGTGAGCLMCILVVILALALAFGILCFEAWILMLLWNAVIPLLFVGAPTLQFWWAVGLLLICNILFKSSSGFKSNND